MPGCQHVYVVVLPVCACVSVNTLWEPWWLGGAVWLADSCCSSCVLVGCPSLPPLFVVVGSRLIIIRGWPPGR